MIEDLKYRKGSACQIYGHLWREGEYGRFTCIHCGKYVLCRECFPNLPQGVETIVCGKHSENEKQVKR